VIEVRELTKVYGLPPARAAALIRDHPADQRRGVVTAAGGHLGADGVSFDVAEGEIFVVMGLSGSGKSTVLRMLNRLVEPTAGEVRINREDVLAMRPAALRHLRNRTIGMVFQHFALFNHRTARDNVAYGLRVRGVPRVRQRDRADDALRRVGLGDRADAWPQTLSGGQRQRVGLARALATEPEILLMDEPFSALDPLIRREMQALLLHLQTERRRTIVFVTHDLAEALRLGDRIMILRDGEVAQCGTAEQILAQPADDYVAAFVADVRAGRAADVA
jgi:glycine/betaine/L-proline transporter ATP-binding subunit